MWLDFTILQPANYMAPWRLPSAFREGVFRLSWSLDRRQSMVAIGDIVEVALLVLKEGQRHYGATYELCSEGRSEEHTSELQSLMCISYAVFCLIKNKSSNFYPLLLHPHLV